jgi:hypothetical protein
LLFAARKRGDSGSSSMTMAYVKGTTGGSVWSRVA